VAEKAVVEPTVWNLTVLALTVPALTGSKKKAVKVRPWLSTNLSRQWEVLLGFRPVQLLKMASAS
jgi:hypothetical protein